MYTFKDYLGLPYEVRSMVTKYWLACLKSGLKVKNAYGIRKKLLTAEERNHLENNWLNKKSRLFNLKEKGEPFRREYVIDEIEKKLPHSVTLKHLFYHPIWHLIGNPHPNSESINTCLKELPPSYTTMIFTEDAEGNLRRIKPLPQKTVRTIHGKTNLHSLCCWVAFSLERQEQENKGFDLNQLHAVKTLLRLWVETPFEVIANEFNRYVNNQFWQLFIDDITKLIHYISFYKLESGEERFLPMRLMSEDPLTLEDPCNDYRMLLNKAIELQLIENEPDQRMRFLDEIMHTQIQYLYDALFTSTDPPKSISDLRTDIEIEIYRRKNQIQN